MKYKEERKLFRESFFTNENKSVLLGFVMKIGIHKLLNNPLMNSLACPLGQFVNNVITRENLE